MKIKQNIKDLCLTESSNYVLVRSQERQITLGEVFTPTELVLEMLEELPNYMWEDGKTFLDPTCGNGQFLASVAIVKRELGHDSVLQSIYGADLMEDNVVDCRKRLYAIAGETVQNKAFLNNNILCKDGLTYGYNFGPEAPVFG